MSRTYRKRPQSFEEYFNEGVWDYNKIKNSIFKQIIKYDVHDDKNDPYVVNQKVRYYSDKWVTYTLPKWYRNKINKKRRRFDNNELWKELNLIDYENLCGKWNCKTSYAWGYW